MNTVQILIICTGQLFALINAKTYIIVDDKLENCAKEDEDLKLYDMSNFEMISYNDTHTFLNGSIVVLRNITSPWLTHSHAEHFERRKWLKQGFNNDCLDFCKQFHDPKKPWYYATKDKQGCPVPAGHVWHLDMIPVEFPESLLAVLPTHYMGQWRLILNAPLEVDGKMLLDCWIGHGEIFMDSFMSTSG